jgi:alkylation response protein AidB-like acyl-CoA dehydrogenase
MDLILTDEQQLISATARELLASRAATAGARAVRATPERHCLALWKEMVELGWTGLAIAEEHGGVGQGWLEACLLIEQMGAAQVPSPFSVTAGTVAPVIDRFGTEAQRSGWLGAIAVGRPVSYARAAPRASWGESGSSLTARARDGGYALSGEALFVPFAAQAEGLVAVADTGGALTVFLVDRPAGSTITPMDVIGPDPLYRVRFDDLLVASDQALGPVGGGAEVVRALEAFGAAAGCAEMVGGARRVLDMTVAYAGQREQFGRPIGGFQAVQHHCADMAVDVLGARLIAFEAIWRLSAQLDEPSEVALTVATAKAWVSDAYQRVCARGQQVHGAIGFTAEHDLHLYTAHASAAALRFGDAEFHLARVADAIGLPDGSPTR